MPRKPRGGQVGRPPLETPTRVHGVDLTDDQWTWAKSQPGGASATIRALIDTAKKEQAMTLAALKKISPDTEGLGAYHQTYSYKLANGDLSAQAVATALGIDEALLKDWDWDRHEALHA